LNYPFNLIK